MLTNTITVILFALSSAIFGCAWVFYVVSESSEGVLMWLKRLVYQKIVGCGGVERNFIVRFCVKMVECERCVAGQFCLWTFTAYYFMRRSHCDILEYSFLVSIAVSLTILVAEFIGRLITTHNK